MVLANPARGLGPSAIDSHVYLFFDRHSGRKVLLTSDVPRERIADELSERYSNNFIRVWSGFEDSLRSHYIVDTFVLSTRARSLAMLLEGGAVLVLEHAFDDDLMANYLSAVTASTIFGYANVTSKSNADLEDMLLNAGNPMDLVAADRDQILKHHRRFEATSESVTFDEMLACERDLALAQRRPPAEPVE